MQAAAPHSDPGSQPQQRQQRQQQQRQLEAVLAAPSVLHAIALAALRHTAWVCRGREEGEVGAAAGFEARLWLACQALDVLENATMVFGSSLLRLVVPDPFLLRSTSWPAGLLSCLAAAVSDCAFLPQLPQLAQLLKLALACLMNLANGSRGGALAVAAARGHLTAVKLLFLAVCSRSLQLSRLQPEGSGMALTIATQARKAAPDSCGDARTSRGALAGLRASAGKKRKRGAAARPGSAQAEAAEPSSKAPRPVSIPEQGSPRAAERASSGTAADGLLDTEAPAPQEEVAHACLGLLVNLAEADPGCRAELRQVVAQYRPRPGRPEAAAGSCDVPLVALLGQMMASGATAAAARLPPQRGEDGESALVGRRQPSASARPLAHDSADSGGARGRGSDGSEDGFLEVREASLQDDSSGDHTAGNDAQQHAGAEQAAAARSCASTGLLLSFLLYGSEPAFRQQVAASLPGRSLHLVVQVVQYYIALTTSHREELSGLSESRALLQRVLLDIEPSDAPTGAPGSTQHACHASA